jgi:putative DNA primase/helicase
MPNLSYRALPAEPANDETPSKPRWQREPVSPDEDLAAFRRFAESHGVILPAEIIADGQLHRCDVTGRNGEGDGAYLLHLDGLPAGGVQNWQDGQGWRDWRHDIGRDLTPAESEELRRKKEADRAKREAARAEARQGAAVSAASMWDKGRTEADEHPYVVRKRIKAHGARRQDRSNNLLIPMRDEHGDLVNLQLIDADGHKRFLGGGIKKGCSFEIGKAVGAYRILFAEGFATAASLHEAAGYPVIVTFDAGNMIEVAKAYRARYPDAVFLFCADDDSETERERGTNPGIKAAREAAAASNGRVVAPQFDPRPIG